MRDTVRRMADEVIRPAVNKMEADKCLDQEVLKKLFETGLVYALSYILYVWLYSDLQKGVVEAYVFGIILLYKPRYFKS